MRRAICSEATCFAQRTSVTLVGLNLLIARGVHGREVRVGDNDFVAEMFDVARAPLTLGRGFDGNADLTALGDNDFVAEMFDVAGDPLTLGRGFDENASVLALREHLIETRPGRLDAALC